MSLLTNLQAAYNFDSSPGNLVDSSGNGYTLTNTGTVTFSAGLIGSCAVFGTSNSTKKLTNATNLGITSGTQNWSVSYWWQSGNVGEQCGNFQLTYGGGTNFFASLYDGANTRYAFISKQGSTFPSSSASINTWYNITIVNSSNVATIYLNGTSIATQATATTTTGLTDHLDMGFSTTNSSFGNGNIDIFNVWGRALTGGEVTSLYNGGAGLQYNFGVNTGSGNFLTFI